MDDRKPVDWLYPFVVYFVTAFALVLAALALFAGELAHGNPPSVWQDWPTLVGDLYRASWGLSAQGNWTQGVLFAVKGAAVGIPVMLVFTGLMHLCNTGRYTPTGAFLQLLRRSWPYMLILMPLPLLVLLVSRLPDRESTSLVEQALLFILLGAIAIFVIFYPEIIARAYLVSLDRARWSSITLLVIYPIMLLLVTFVIPTLLVLPSLSLEGT